MSRINLKLSGEDSLEQNFTSKTGTIRHNTGRRNPILPFNTKWKESAIIDLKSFTGIIGESYRLLEGKAFPEELKNSSLLKEVIIKNVLEKVKTDDKEELIHIIQKLFFDDSNGLIKFNVRALSYMIFDNYQPQFKEISKFIYSIFLREISLDTIISKQNRENIFYQLIYESLPPLTDTKNKESIKHYNNLLPSISNAFIKDFKFLMKNESFFLNNVENLFKYYYFFYTSQLAMKLNRFGVNSGEKRGIYFSMDWESLSISRNAYSFGWKILEHNIKNLFSHVNTVELLSYLSIDDEFVEDYESLVEKSEGISDEVIEYIRELSTFYTSRIEEDSLRPKTWSDCEQELISILENRYTESTISREIYSLWYRINFQFLNSTRKKPYDDYSKWLVRFIKSNFIKNRGRLGATTVLNQEMLLFLTKLIIADNSKIRLKNLWEQFEERGILFDDTSKVEIVKLFEKINLLEKKSDSGNAQYVKSSI